MRALSCLIRDHALLHAAFISEHNGLDVLVNALHAAHDNASHLTKIIFFLSNLVTADPSLPGSLSIDQKLISLPHMALTPRMTPVSFSLLLFFSF